MTSKLKMDALETVSGAGKIQLVSQLSGMTSESLPSGSVLQVVHVNKVDSFVGSSQTWHNITGLSATITPTYASSKILLTCVVQVGGQNDWGGSHFRMVRDGVVLTVGSTAGHQVNAHTGGLMRRSGHSLDSKTLLEYDSPNTTSAVTYTLQGYPENDDGGGTVYINTCNQPDTDYTSNGVSSIVLTEIKG